MEKNNTLNIQKIILQETRLFCHQYDNYKNLNDLLKKDLERIRREDPKGMDYTNKGCWRSMRKYACESDLHKPIHLILQEWVKHYIPQHAMDARVTYWTNINEPGSSNAFHNHVMTDCDVSGVYYVQGTGTGSIRFATHEQVYKLIPPYLPYGRWTRHQPMDGDILLFPSHLLHDVLPNTHKSRQRISIAFNVKFVVRKNNES